MIRSWVNWTVHGSHDFDQSTPMCVTGNTRGIYLNDIYYWKTGWKILCQQTEMVTNMVHITETPWWVRWRLKSPASRVFTQPFVQAQIIFFHAQIKENFKAPRHRPLWGEFIGDRRIPPHKGPVTRKIFPFDDVIIKLTYIFSLPLQPIVFLLIIVSHRVGETPTNNKKIHNSWRSI